MKNIFLLAALLSTTGLSAQWVPGGNTTTHFTAISFPNDSVGYAAGSDFYIYRTGDGGASWHSTTTGSSNHTSICFLSAVEGYAGDYFGRIYWTYDGGSHWVQVGLDSFPNVPVMDIVFQPNGAGYALTAYGGVYITHDGNLWSHCGQISSQTRAIFFTSADTGFIAGGNIAGQVWKTVDAGVTWTQVYIGPDMQYDVFFPTPRIGYAVGAAASVNKTTDGGNTWNPLVTGFGGNNMSVWFTDSLTGYIASDTGGIYTLNGGATWKRMIGNTTSQGTDICFSDPCHGFISTWAGNVYMTRAETFVSPATPTTNCDSVVLAADTAGCNNCQYAWSNGATGNRVTLTSGGTYTVTMTNACGSATASQVVQVLHKPSGTIMVNRVINNYTFYCTAQNNPTSYHWSFSDGTTDSLSSFNRTLITAGQLIVTLTIGNTCGSNTCYDTLNIVPDCNYQLSQHQITTDSAGTTMSVNITNIGCQWRVDTTSCPWLHVTPTSGSGNGTFDVIIPPNNDTVVRQCSLTIDSQYILVVQFGKHGSVSCNAVDTSVQVNGCDVAAASIGGASYQWYRNGVALSNGNSQYYSATANGYYHVAINVGSCYYQSNDHYLSVCAGIDDPAVNNLNVYPNPSGGTFTLTGDASEGTEATTSVFNTLGQLVFEKITEGTTGYFSEEISMQGQPAGIYQLLFSAGNKTISVRLIIAGGLK